MIFFQQFLFEQLSIINSTKLIEKCCGNRSRTFRLRMTRLLIKL